MKKQLVKIIEPKYFSPEELEDQLNKLANEGYRVVTVCDVKPYYGKRTCLILERQSSE